MADMSVCWPSLYDSVCTACGGGMLTVSCRDFIEAFCAIGDFFDRPPCVESSFCCVDGKLRLRTEGMEIDVPVQGYYDGVIWLTAEATYGLAKIARHRPPPPGGKVTISDGIMRVGRMTLPVRYEDEQKGSTILVPKDAPLLFWLTLEHKHTPAEIEAAGLTEMVAEAHVERNALIEEAAWILSPLGVKKAAILQVIEQNYRPKIQ